MYDKISFMLHNKRTQICQKIAHLANFTGQTSIYPNNLREKTCRNRNSSFMRSDFPLIRIIFLLCSNFVS